MANQISKEAILNFLNKRLESHKNRVSEITSMECATNVERSTKVGLEISNYSAMGLLESIIGNIEIGNFDENIPDGLKQLHQWGEQSM
jgi:hypothetical protein